MENRKYRMYGLVPYNISPIQQAIQFGHAVVEYGLYAHETAGGRTNDEILDKYLDWANNDKVFIILNGGTTNKRTSLNSGEPWGTLNQHLLELEKTQIPLSTFYEEDLGDQLTAITFLVDDRVWDKEEYPDYDYFIEQKGNNNPLYKDTPWMTYDQWLEKIGGKQNLFLREFLSQFRLA